MAPKPPRRITTPAGQIAPGNINLNSRPVVHNPDGSISTVRSITVGADGHYVVIPTVIGPRIVPNDVAIRHWQRTGQNLGTFVSEQAANRYAQQLHAQQAKLYAGR